MFRPYIEDGIRTNVEAHSDSTSWLDPSLALRRPKTCPKSDDESRPYIEDGIHTISEDGIRSIYENNI